MNLRRLPAPEVVGRRESIARLGSTINDPDLYQNIEKALLNRRAFFFESADGFAVLKPYPDYMLVWVAISHHSNYRRGIHERYFTELEQLSRIAASPAIRFWTVRRGFSRICQNLGYESRRITHNDRPITIWEKSL